MRHMIHPEMNPWHEEEDPVEDDPKTGLGKKAPKDKDGSKKG